MPRHDRRHARPRVGRELLEAGVEVVGARGAAACIGACCSGGRGVSSRTAQKRSRPTSAAKPAP